MNPLPHGIRNLLFDLGGVLYEVDYTRTTLAFNTLAQQRGLQPIDFSQQHQAPVFDTYECGRMSTEDFRLALHQLLGFTLEDQVLDRAWCAMLLGLMPSRIELLAALKPHYRLALLSNTNAIHWQRVGVEIEPIKPFFQELYLSYEVGLRKPTLEIYQLALQGLEWQADETLFIDDSEQNVLGAKSAGLHAYHLQQPAQLATLLGVAT